MCQVKHSKAKYSLRLELLFFEESKKKNMRLYNINKAEQRQMLAYFCCECKFHSRIVRRMWMFASLSCCTFPKLSLVDLLQFQESRNKVTPCWTAPSRPPLRAGDLMDLHITALLQFWRKQTLWCIHTIWVGTNVASSSKTHVSLCSILEHVLF